MLQRIRKNIRVKLYLARIRRQAMRYQLLGNTQLMAIVAS
jgi:hypothetical protein